MRRVLLASAVIAFAAATLGAQPKYRAPKTAWGDPDISGTYTNKYEIGTPFEKHVREAVFEYGCHEGNYALRNILSAARAEEREAAESAARK